MTSPPDDTTTDTSGIIAALRAERDAGLAREATLAEELAARTAELAERNTGYSERVEQQAGTVGDPEALTIENQELRAAQAAGLEVLQAMIASPGDTQPVFDLIARLAADLCEVPIAAVAMFDGRMVRLVAQSGFDAAYADVFAKQFPRSPSPDFAMGRAIVNRRVEQIEDTGADTQRDFKPPPGPGSALAVPLLRNGAPLGVIAVGRRVRGSYSKNQITLLKTFAEQAVIAISSAETYRALQELTEALTTRNSEYGERIEQQTATIDVLRAMSASPTDLDVVFDLIVRRARGLCDANAAALYEYDDDLIHRRARASISEEETRGEKAFASRFPMRPGRDTIVGRAILERRVVNVADVGREPRLHQLVRDLGGLSAMGAPLLRDGQPIGAIVVDGKAGGGFSDSQVELLNTFAEQAVIAITSAETYRALQTRTADLQETLEYQTATSDVLNVISRSAFDLQPVLDTVVQTSARLCNADRAAIIRREGDLWRLAVNFGFPPAWEDYMKAQGAFSPDRFSEHAAVRAVMERRPVHIDDMAAVPGYGMVRLGEQRTTLGVPLLREGEAIGTIVLARLRVEPFTDRQIELVSTFADQAVIAIENTRLLTEQQEALEQQTATAEVLQVINTNPGNLTPVFDAILDKAHNLCDVAVGSLSIYLNGLVHTVATRGFSEEYQELLRRPYPAIGSHQALMRGGPSNQTADFRTVPVSPEMASSFDHLERMNLRTGLWVPLRKDGTALGCISSYRDKVQPFSEKEIALLENFAAQAVIAMENARLLTEQQEALEQQTATADVLRVINASPGDLTPVFDAILDKAHSLCGATVGNLAVYKGGSFYAVATHGFPEQVASLMPHPSAPNAYTRELIRGERFHQIEDIRAIEISPHYLILRALVEYTDVRTVLFVPLRKDGALLGFISVNRPEVRPFSEKEISLLENFAAQAVIAMENARLLNEQREALEQQTATAEVLGVINASPGNLVPVFDAILEKAMRLCEAGFGSLYTYDGDRFQSAAQRGVSAAYAAYRERRPPELVGEVGLDEVIRTRRAVQVTDMMAERPYLDGNPNFRAMVDLGGMRTAMVVPLCKDETALGVISVFRQEVRPFSDKQIALLENFATQAVIAMENARLLNELRARTDELAQRQAELRITFENMGDGVAMFDETQYLAAWNRKFQDILDLPDALLGQHRTYEEHLLFLAGRGDFGPGIDTVEQINELVASTGQPYGYERTRPDGRVIEIRRNPVPDGGFVLIYSDITERKRSEEEIRAARDAAETALRELKIAQANLIQAEKMASLGQLTAGIAHEIKNPLNFVNNFSALSTELIDELRDVLAPEPLGETARTEVDDLTALLKGNLEKVVQHGRRADGIVRSMLDHSRGSSGERRMVDLNALIDEALNLAYHGARAQDQSFNIALERDFGAGIAPIEVNPQDITRVFLNIFGNGFYAVTRRVRSGGDAGFVPTLKVTTIDAGDAVEIRVRDNGTGIPADIRDKLFQPFFTTKPTGEGTGLGLSITYDIVTQQHGGSIAVDSNVGEYSEFTIRLPRNP